MHVSVLCPSRGRPAALAESVASLIDTATLPEYVEVLVRVDDDDQPYPRPPRCRFRSGPRYGYAGLHRYYNELAEMATGTWLLVWNDDARMCSPGWDVRIADLGPCVASPTTNHGTGAVIFPAVPAEWVRQVGHVSLSPHNDSWWEYVGRELGVLRYLPDVVVRHERADLTGGHDDDTFAARSYDTAGFLAADTQAAIARDAEVIRCASVG